MMGELRGLEYVPVEERLNHQVAELQAQVEALRGDVASKHIVMDAALKTAARATEQIEALRAALENRVVHAPLLSAEKLQQLLGGGHFDYDLRQKASIEFELVARAALGVKDA